MTSPTLWRALRGLNSARLITAAVVLAVAALLVQADGFPYSLRHLTIVVLAAALACGVLPLVGSRVKGMPRFARLQLAVDALLVTAIVATTGGPRSVFMPLYVLAVMAASLILTREDAFAMAGVSSLLYTALVLGGTVLAGFGWRVLAEPSVFESLTILLNAAVLFVIAYVTSSLAERYRESQEHLDAERRQLSDVEAFRDLIFQSVGSGLVAIDANRRVTAFNRAAESITGVRAADALGQPWHAIFGDSTDLDAVRDAVAQEPGVPRRYEFPIRRQDGRQVPVGISFWPLRTGQGDIAGLIGVCQDLSTIKQMEQRVRQADRLAAVGRLSANMAHEIRNPLASISGAVEALAKELPFDEGRSRLVEIVLRESERLSHIVGDFLEYARPAPATPLDVDLVQILDEVLLLIEHRSVPADLKVVRAYPETLPARVDPQQVRQAIWNLCLNAVQSMSEGGEVHVGARRITTGGSEQIQIWISDAGHGIADEDLPHIFEPFYSTKPEGSGLGLALVYRILQDHGGHVEVKSRVGEGTTFTIALPAAPQLTTAPPPSPTRRP